MTGMWKKAVVICAALPSMVLGQEHTGFLCEGTDPDWTLTLHEDIATLNFQRRSEMTIPHQTAAEGRDWPRAMTLISRNDTAIVIIDQQSCGSVAYSAQVLTQRGETPILLTGCCTATP